MTLLSTLWNTVKWKKVLYWYIGLTIMFWFAYDPANGPIVIAIAGQIGMTILAIMPVMMVWSSVITGRNEGFPILWIFSTVVKDIQIFDKDDVSGQLFQMKHWCDENCSGKWKYCKHGYFVFRKKTDAMGFKLTWLE